MELEGKVAVIAGAAQGIGEGMARRFVSEGCRVAGVDIQGEGLDALESELGNSFMGIQADLSSAEEIERRRPLLVGHLIEANTLTEVEMLVHPLPPFGIIDRKYGLIPLTVIEQFQKCFSCDLYRLSGHTGRTDRKKPTDWISGCRYTHKRIPQPFRFRTCRQS